MLGFFKSCLTVDVHGLIMIAVSTIFFFSPVTHAGMEEYLLDLFMVFYMELTECEEEKKSPHWRRLHGIQWFFMKSHIREKKVKF